MSTSTTMLQAQTIAFMITLRNVIELMASLQPDPEAASNELREKLLFDLHELVANVKKGDDGEYPETIRRYALEMLDRIIPARDGT